jgi:cell surface protein SprA
MVNKFTPLDRGSFSISIISIGTSFKGTDADNNSETYDNLKTYRKEIAYRLANQNPSWDGTQVDSTGFPSGYSPTSQEVLHYSFLAAYTGKTAATIKLNPFPAIPMPNWRLTYKGLSNIELIKQYFRDVTISHAYRSTYNVGNFVTNVLYRDDLGFPSAMDGANNFISKFQISQIAITEQFAPLFGLDLTWKNNILSKFEIKKSRNLSVSFTGNQLTEILSDEIVMGVGYRFKDVEIGFLSSGGGAAKKYKSDLNLKADVSVKTNKTVLRRISEGINQISAGQKVITINTSADYQMNDKVTLRLFFDKILTNPFVSNQYASSTTSGGISLRFTLSQ